MKHKKSTGGQKDKDGQSTKDIGLAAEIECRLQALERQAEAEKGQERNYKDRQLGFNRWLTFATIGLLACAVIGIPLALEQACTARTTAQAAAQQVSDSESQFIADQRPYIVVHGEGLEVSVGKPGEPAMFKRNVTFANIGKSQALRENGKICMISFIPATPVVNEVDRVFGIAAAYARSDESNGLGIDIAPEDPIFATAVLTDAQCTAPASPDGLEMSPAQFDEWIGGKRVILMVADVTYHDPHGGGNAPVYETQYCAMKNAKFAWQFCPNHNTIR